MKVGYENTLYFKTLIIFKTIFYPMFIAMFKVFFEYMTRYIAGNTSLKIYASRTY